MAKCLGFKPCGEGEYLFVSYNSEYTDRIDELLGHECGGPAIFAY